MKFLPLTTLVNMCDVEKQFIMICDYTARNQQKINWRGRAIFIRLVQ